MYQNDQRQSLFGEAPTRRTNLFAQQSLQQPQISPFRTPSPYEKPNKTNSAAYNASLLSTLESQNNEELDSITGKVKLLKDLGLKMGDEIRNSTKTMDSLNDTFNLASTKVKLTYNKMIIMSKNAGISWQMWFLLFFAVFLLFFWVWIT